MSALRIAALTAVVAAAAVGCALHGLRPPRRSIAQVRALLYAPTATAARAAGADTTRAARTRSSALAARVARVLGADLELVDLDAAGIVSRMVAAGAIGAFTVVVSVAALAAAGVLAPSPIWLFVAVAVGAAFAWVMWSDVRTRVERQRRALRRAANDFVQLVAIGLTTDQSVDEAIRFAVSVGDSDMFDLLRAELATAPVRGVPVWEALDHLGKRFHQRELCEFASSIERQGMQGVSITDTVNTLAAAMRAKTLDELERDADRANANLSGPTIGFVVTTIVFLAYPLAIRIGEAFGG